MKQYIKTHFLLLALVAAAVLVSLTAIARRWQSEAGNRSYDVVLDYNELELLAEQSDQDIAWWL